MFFFAQTDNMVQLKRLDAFVSEQAKQHKLKGAASEIKTFTKAFYEIRYRFDQSEYFPNFENFTLAQMVETICLLEDNKDPAIVSAWNVETIQARFWKLTRREISELEKDLLEVFS